MTAFDDSFDELHGAEGNYSNDPRDPGNWTGGKVGVGELKGTKYGVSAKSYPHLDIINLTLAEAKVIAKRDYWDLVRGDDLPPAVAHAIFDTAYNQGVGAAIILFQKAVKVTPDGNFGPLTLQAYQQLGTKKFARAFTIGRILRYSSTPGWDIDAAGWTGRALDAFADIVVS